MNGAPRQFQRVAGDPLGMQAGFMLAQVEGRRQGFGERGIRPNRIDALYLRGL